MTKVHHIDYRISLLFVCLEWNVWEFVMVGWLVVLRFNATLTAKVISRRSVTHKCFLAFSHRFYHKFLSKTTDYFSYMLQQRWGVKIRRKEILPQPGLELTSTRLWVRHAQHWATQAGQEVCDRWSDGWMDWWMDWWMNEWMDEWIEGWIDWRRNGLTNTDRLDRLVGVLPY